MAGAATNPSPLLRRSSRPDWEAAGAIASALLLEPVLHVIDSELVREGITNDYAVMLEHCDVNMLQLIPGGFLEWITLTGSITSDQ